MVKKDLKLGVKYQMDMYGRLCARTLTIMSPKWRYLSTKNILKNKILQDQHRELSLTKSFDHPVFVFQYFFDLDNDCFQWVLGVLVVLIILFGVVLFVLAPERPM